MYFSGLKIKSNKMENPKIFPTTEDGIKAILPTKVKVIKPVQGVYINLRKTGTKMLPIMPTNIPVGTIIQIKVNEKDNSQIETDFKVDNNVVFTTPKQLLGNVEFVSDKAEVSDEPVKDGDSKKEEKKFFTTTNILIGVGILVGGFLLYKYVLKRN